MPARDPRDMIHQAEMAARLSPCGSRQVGCVLLSESWTIVGVGWNCAHSEQAFCARCRDGVKDARCPALHAELMALAAAAGKAPRTAFSTHSPCFSCAWEMSRAGIVQIRYREVYDGGHMDAIRAALPGLSLGPAQEWLEA